MVAAGPALRALIEAEGVPGPGGPALAFERFMEAALYDPDRGYYSRRVRGVGRGGDFSTAPTLGPALGIAVAAWAAGVADDVRAPGGSWHLVEVGGGSGALARAVLDAAATDPPSYHIVERSQPLVAVQRQALAGLPVTWHTEVATALTAAGGRALVVSNELVDAFPCVVVERHGGRWETLHLGLDGDAVVERWRDGPLPVSPWSARHQPAPEGQRCEVHTAWRNWMAGWLPGLRAGHLLTIDYGDEVEGLYHRRPRGTLRAYFQHLPMAGDEVYARFGHQDITADVNFTDLRAWGEALGLRTRSLCDQRRFVLDHVPALAESTDPATHFVLDPDGMGGAFKVLWQQV